MSELVARGHEVWVFCGGWSGSVAAGSHIIVVPQISLRGLHTISFGVAVSFCLLWRLTRVKPDVIYSRFFNTLFVPATIAVAQRVPLFVEVNGDPSTEHRSFGRTGAKVAFWTWAERQAYEKACGVVVVAPGIARSIRTRFPQVRTPLYVVENGVDTSVFSPQSRRAARASLGFDQEQFIAVYVGGLQAYQGINDAIDAIDVLRQQGVSILFVIVGDGRERAQIEARIVDGGLQKHVVLAGDKPPRQAALYISAADVCLAPYNELAAAKVGGCAYGAEMDRSPLKVFAYLACGRPVIASHFREAGAFLVSHDVGLAVPPGSSAALAEVLMTCMREPAYMNEMGQRAAALAQREFGWGRVVEDLEKVLRGTSSPVFSGCTQQ